MQERTLADIDEEIAAVRAAYLEALKMSIVSPHSVVRPALFKERI